MEKPVSWTIRPATADDADTLALIGTATFLDTYAGILDGGSIGEHVRRVHCAQAYATFLANGARAWIAECAPGAAPVGYALVTEPELDLAQDGDIELKRIYVLSRFQGTGIARALMDTVVNECADRQRLLVGVKQDNDRALSFYAAHEFEPIGTRQFQVGSHIYNDFVLARSLSHDNTDDA